ncbi:MAG: phytanoyl-CoA dioxygenase family protein [Caulobacteraceae bacterium]
MSSRKIESTAKNERAELLRRGFLVVPDILTAAEIACFCQATDALLKESEELQRSFRSQGSMIPTTRDSRFLELIANPKALAALARLGWLEPTFTDGYVISKPAGAPPLFWHYDWFAWSFEAVFEPVPPQIFAMYYLTNTNPANGCLRVIPGSHVELNPLHGQLREPHRGALSAAVDLTDPAFSHRPDELDVPVRAGDLIIGDARLLHAAHANSSGERRTLITLWYQPDVASLPEPVQAQMVAKIQHPDSSWPAEARARLETLFPSYIGKAQPYPRELHPASRAGGSSAVVDKSC